MFRVLVYCFVIFWFSFEFIYIIHISHKNFLLIINKGSALFLELGFKITKITLDISKITYISKSYVRKIDI